jgi:hypothetical protein
MAVTFPNLSFYDTQLKTYMQQNYVPLGSTSYTKVANTLFVSTNGVDTNDGSINSPLKTITKALALATSGTTIYVFAGLYNESIVLKDGVNLVGASKYQTIVNGMTTFNTAGQCFVSNILFKSDIDTIIDITGGDQQDFIINNCIIDSLTNDCTGISYGNSNPLSKLTIKDSALNLHESNIITTTSVIYSTYDSQGSIINNNSSLNVLDNIDNVALNLNNTVNYTQIGGKINGQVIINNTTTATLKQVEVTTNTVECIVNNSTATSKVIDSILNTTNALSVSGIGLFSYSNLIGKPVSNSLNEGLGGNLIGINKMRLNNSALLPNEALITGNYDGIIEFDNASLYVVANKVRKNLLNYLDLENKPSIPSNTSDLTNDAKFIKTGNIKAGSNITLEVVGDDVTINSSGSGTGGSLTTLSDTNIVSSTNNQVLAYNSTSQKYENKNFNDIASTFKYLTPTNIVSGTNVSLTKVGNDVTINASVDTTGLVTDSELTSSLSGKADTNHTHAYNTITGTPDLTVYVQKETGKGLSANDYDSTAKTKVDGIITNGTGTKYKTDDGSYKEIVLPTSAGGNSSNMYFLNRNSTADANFKGLAYIPSTSEILKTTTVNNNEVLISEHLFDTIVDVSTINAGNWRFLFHGYCSSSIGTNKIRVEVFMRNVVTGVEQELFSVYSNNIINTISETIEIDTTKGIYSINNDDNIGFRLYASTTNTTDTTITVKFGGDESAYLNTPLPIRHDSLRNFNSNSTYQHITQTQKDQLHGHTNLLVVNNLGVVGDNLLAFNGKAVTETLDTTGLMKSSDYASNGQVGIVDKAVTLDTTGSSPLQVYGTDALGQAKWMNYPIVIPTTSTLTQRVLYNLTTDVPKTIAFNSTNPLHQVVIQCYEEIQEQALTDIVDNYTKSYSVTKTNDVTVDTTGTYIKDNYIYNLTTTTDLYGYIQKESEEININNFVIIDTII